MIYKKNMGCQCSVRDAKKIVWKRSKNFFSARTYEKESVPPREVFNDAALWRHEASRGGIRSACPSANMTYARMHTRVCAAIRHNTIRTWLNACDATCLTYLENRPFSALAKDDGVHISNYKEIDKNWHARTRLWKICRIFVDIYLYNIFLIIFIIVWIYKYNYVNIKIGFIKCKIRLLSDGTSLLYKVDVIHYGEVTMHKGNICFFLFSEKTWHIEREWRRLREKTRAAKYFPPSRRFHIQDYESALLTRWTWGSVQSLFYSEHTHTEVIC